MATPNFEVYAAKLTDPKLDLSSKLAVASDLTLLDVQPADYSKFLSCIMPAFEDILTNVQPAFTSESTEQKLRNTILEILQRIPYNENLKQYAADLLKMVMNTLREDNEENAAICLRIIIELHKNYRNVPALEEYVHPFFEFVKEMLNRMERNVVELIDKATFIESSLKTVSSPEAIDSGNVQKKYLQSVNSFKVLSECPIILVLLISIYKKFIANTIPTMVPLIVKAICLRVGAQKQYADIHAEPLRAGPNPEIKNKVIYGDFIGAQVKIMSFLAYIIKGFSSILKPQQNLIAESIINLLLDCPTEASSTRKELLVAARHILSTEFRAAFIPFIDILFNEDVLVGQSIASKETLRPLAYSMLADLIHHVRPELTMPQISKTIFLYTRNLHDSSLAPSIQTMCAKLLLNLIDCIIHNSNREEARRLLIRMLDAFTSKFGSLKFIIEKLVKRFEEKQENGSSPSLEEIDEKVLIDIEHMAPIHTSSVLVDHYQTDIAKDYKFLFKTLVLGLKTILYGLKNLSNTAQPGTSASPNNKSNTSLNAVPPQLTPVAKLSYEEQQLFIRLFVDGLSCFEIFKIDMMKPAEPLNRSIVIGKEEKEVLEHFVTVFTLIDLAVFHEVFYSQIGFFFQHLLKDAAMLAIPQYLLASETVSKSFSGILLQYLMDNLEQLGKKETNEANMMLRLFKLVFMAITLFPESNEIVLQPYISELITQAMQLASKTESSNNYFLLLRALFRNIGGGRFELLYKEVLPLLPMLLKGLNNRLNSNEKPATKELFVELCLTVPVRLSVLLPYLHFLMRPLVLALQAGPELVSQGLRTLELCIDNLTAEFLDPILSPVIKDMTKALWRHLQPLPYNNGHSHATLRILGKLGGRNRRFLKEAIDLKYENLNSSALSIPIVFDSSKPGFMLTLDKILPIISEIFNSDSSTQMEYEHSFQFLSNIFPLLIDTELPDSLTLDQFERFVVERLRGSPSSEILEKMKQNIEKYLTTKLENTSNALSLDIDSPTWKKREKQSKVLQTIIVNILIACSVDAVKEEALKLKSNLVHHFAMLKLIESFGLNVRSLRMVRQSTAIDCLESNPFIEALVEVFTSQNEAVRLIAKETLKEFYSTLLVLVDDIETVNKLPAFHLLSSKFCSACYKTDWSQKLGGSLGILTLCTELELSQQWVLDHELEIIKALLYTFKDMPTDWVASHLEDIQNTFFQIIKICNESQSEDSKKQKEKFNRLMNLLIGEFFNANAIVRQCVQKSFGLLAELQKTTTTELLMPLKDRMLTPIFSKPLRALPFPMQIGYIDAITFCLSLEPPLLTFNDELIRLLQEALALADADDQALVSKSSQLKNTQSLTLLRIVCVKLLAVTMSLEEFSSHQNLNSTRFRVVQVFFKSLYSKSNEIVEAAKKGVQQALSLQHHRLPKELLQTGLRPILMNISDPKKLTSDGLAGLARLLELLCSYFKVEIGKKLLDHLDHWATPPILELAALKTFSEAQEIKVINGILELMHLLPSGANIFLDDMVKKVVFLEDSLRKTISSPFRIPLAKFINKYPNDSVEYFVAHLNDPKSSRLLVDLIDSPLATLYAEKMRDSTEAILNASFLSSKSNDINRYYATLAFEKLAKLFPNWLSEGENDIFEVLIDYWRTADKSALLSNEESLELPQLYIWQHMIQIFMIYCQESEEEIETLFDLIDIFTLPTTLDFNHVKQFIYEKVALNSNPKRIKNIFLKFLDDLTSDYVVEEKKILSLKLLVLPSLHFTLQKGNQKEILDDKTLKLVNEKIWTPLLNANNRPFESQELQMQFLQLTCLILKHYPEAVSNIQKNVILYAWFYVKHEDSILRNASYVVLCHFIRHYNAVGKMINQIFSHLLKSHQSESRNLVKQSLDLLMPVLPLRLKDENQQTPAWVKWTRKYLNEDSHMIPQVIAIWQTIFRHPDLFYDYRDLYIPMIVGSLPKFGLTPSATMDTRLLTIELVELLLKWEQKRVAQAQLQKEDAMDIDEPPPLPAGRKKRGAASANSTPAQSPRKRQATGRSTPPLFLVNDYTPETAYREIIVNYLSRFLCTLNDSLIRKGWATRIVSAIEAFHEPEMWSDVNVKMSFFEKFFASTEINESNVSNIPNILDAIYIVVKNKSSEWFTQNLMQLKSCCERCLNQENTKIVENIVKIIQKAYQTMETAAIQKVSSFTTFIQNLTTENLVNGKNTYAVVGVLKAISDAYSAILEPMLPNLTKLLQRLIKDYPPLASPTASVTQPIPSLLSMIISLLEMLNGKLGQLGENKKSFFNSIVMLIDKSNEKSIHLTLLDMMKSWVYQNNQHLTMKEKSLLIQKFSHLETRAENDIFKDYLEFVLDIYRNESLAYTELTVRLESVFLMGLRYRTDLSVCEKYLAFFEKQLPKNLFVRLSYILGVQNWEPLANHYWIPQILDILFNLVKQEHQFKPNFGGYQTLSIQILYDSSEISTSKSGAVKTELKSLLKQHLQFLKQKKVLKFQDLFEPLKLFYHRDLEVAHNCWSDLFPLFWESFTNKERQDINKHLISLLAREYHSKQMDLRPNVIQTLLNAVTKCRPQSLLLPPQLVKYLAKNFQCWYISLHILQDNLIALENSNNLIFKEQQKIRDLILDAMQELYLQLSEDDYFYGLWRRRCLYPETNAALSFEQLGCWQSAQSIYESAQLKAKNGFLAYSESEYSLWEDRWIACTQKLQQWDLCNDLAKHDHNLELQLACAWRVTDWFQERDSLQHAVSIVSEQPTPNHKIYEAFMLLTLFQEQAADKLSEFQKICDEGIQLCLKQWHGLPSIISTSHMSTLHLFQQYVELQEASHVYLTLGTNNLPNKVQAMQELKGTLGTWRDRLPNLWDDISIWSELVAWRQHVFSVINKAYQPLADQAGSQSNHSLAYRGYHEIAWIINRFAHVARKHDLMDVCIHALTKIYTLPNIEIQDAFLKLREQAKCYFRDPNEYGNGLEVINNTNLGYFQQPQRAEFFTLKGMFLGKLDFHDEANQSFSSAIQIDVHLPKGWSAWAKYNDQMYRQKGDLNDAANAVNCYLHACSLYKNNRCRKYIARILWLLEEDDAQGTVAKAFEVFKGELSIWYWISFIPQLLLSLGRKEARHAKSILIRIAKTYPQSLYYLLRAAREDYKQMKAKMSQTPAATTSSSSAATPSASNNDVMEEYKMDIDQDEEKNEREKEAFKDAMQIDQQEQKQPQSKPDLEDRIKEEDSIEQQQLEKQQAEEMMLNKSVRKNVSDHLEDVMSILKTAYPLLALSIETTVDQMISRLRPTPDEEVYRIVMALLTDGFQQLITKISMGTLNEDPLTQQMIQTIERFINSPYVSSSKHKAALEQDFISSQPTLEQLVMRYREWRSRLENILDNRPKVQNLEHFSPYLVEFEYQKFDDVEVPGQYLLLKDNNADFVKIERILSEFEYVRGHGIWYRKLTMIGQDGSSHVFNIHNPSSRSSKREERIVQLLRLMNSVLEKKKESRKRNLMFHLPLIVPLAPTVRLVEYDSSYCSMQEVYEDYCERLELQKDAPMMTYLDRLKQIVQTRGKSFQDSKQELLAFNMEMFDYISHSQVPENMLSKFMLSSMSTFSDFFVLRKHFSSQLAMISFISYVLSIGHRQPHKLLISRKTGNLWMMELLPLLNTQMCFNNPEPVPFRLTPNFQEFITTVGMEGSFVGSLMSVASSLTMPEFELENILGIFVRDELNSWRKITHPNGISDSDFKNKVQENIQIILKRVEQLAATQERQKAVNETNVPISQSVLELISTATNVQRLASMDVMWQPWI